MKTYILYDRANTLAFPNHIDCSAAAATPAILATEL